MANILTESEAGTVLRCEITDADMLALLPLVDAFIKDSTGHDWAADAEIVPQAKSAARMLLTLWHENPGMTSAGVNSMNYGLRAAIYQLKAIALRYREFFGRNGAGEINLPGVYAGDTVSSVVGLIGATGDQKSSFETVISETGEIQQVSTSDLSAKMFRAFFTPPSEL
jgi:hypothetical protein